MPGALFEVGPPGVLKPFADALTLLPTGPIPAWYPWGSWYAVNARVPIAALDTSRALHTRAVLGNTQKETHVIVKTLYFDVLSRDVFVFILSSMISTPLL